MKKNNNKNILNVGEDFKRKNNIKNDYFKEYYTLNQCYNKWSIYKQQIYNYYYDLLQKNCDSVINYGIRGFNCMIITLHAIIKKNNKKYYLLITPKNNYFMEL